MKSDMAPAPRVETSRAGNNRLSKHAQLLCLSVPHLIRSTPPDMSKASGSDPVRIPARPYLNRRSSLFFATLDIEAQTDHNHTDLFIIPPDSSFRSRWTLLSFCVTLYLLIATSYRIAFRWSTEVDAWLIFEVFVDAFFICDMIFQFRVGFVVDGRHVLNPSKIRTRYLSSWFWLDFVALLPVDILQPVLLSAGLIMPIFRCNKLLRVFRIQSTISDWESNPAISTIFIRLLKLSVYATLLLHFVACGWFLFAQFEGFGVNAWVPPTSLANRDLYSYLFAYFVSLNMVAGIGNWVVPTSNIEFLFANTVCLIGIFAFAYVVGILDSIADMLLDAKRRIGQQMDRSLCMLEQQNVTQVTYARVQQYYQYVWSANEGVDVSETLHLLPDSLRSEVAVLLSSSMLERVSFFSRADPSFLLSVASMLKPLIAVPGQYIVREGDPGSEMFFVQRGSAEVLVGVDEKCVRELTAGDFFGEMALLFTTPRSASVRTTSHCDMFSLTQADLELLMRLFPDESERIKREATQKKRRQSYVKGVTAPGHRKRISIDRFAAARATALSINTAESSASPTLSSSSSTLTYFNALNQSPTSAAQSTSPSNRRQAVKFADSPPNIPDSSSNLESLSNSRFQLPPVARPSSLNRIVSMDSTAESVESDTNKPPARSQLPSLEALPALRQSTSLRRIRSLESTSSSSVCCCSQYFSDEPFVFIRNESTVHRLWRFVIFILIMYNIIGVPFRCSFCPYLFNLPLSLFDWAGDLILLCNIWVVSRLAFYEHGVLITDLRRIRAKRLVRICLDLIACLPVLDCLILVPEWGAMSNYRLPRLLLFHQLYRLYDSDSIKLRTGRHAVEIVQLVCVVLLLSHFVACAYFAFTINSGFEDSYHWLPGTQYANATMFQQYSRSFFFAIVYLTGMGAVAKPATIGQAMFSNMVMLIGKFFAAFLIGIVANAIGELSTFRTSFFAFLFRLNQMIKRHASSISLAQNSSINKFLEHSWSVYQGIDQNAVISSLPMDLRVTVVMEIAGKVLSESTLFQTCSQSVLRAVAQHIQLEYLPADEQLFSDGQFGDKCYFIGDGEVELQYPTKSSQPVTLSRGALLAPQALRACRHSYSIRSITALQLFSLSSQAFMQLEMAFPELTRRYVLAIESDMNSRRPSDLPLVVRQVVSTDHSSQQELIDQMMKGTHQSASFEIRNASESNTDAETTEPASHWCCTDSRSVYQVSDVSLHQSQPNHQTVFTISPTSTSYHVLMIAKFMFSFYVVVHQSYRITFQWFHSTTPSEPYDPYFPLDCIADAFFLTDIWLGFRTGFMHRGNLNMHLGDIRQHYIQRGTFLVDFLAVLPLELLCFVLGVNVSLGVLRLNKLLRVVFLPSFLHYLASRPGINLALIRFALLLLYMFLLLHFVACGWFGLADIEGFGADSWIATGSSSDYYAYLNALFLALNLVGGVGDCGIPQTLFELCFANVCSVIGVFMFAFMIGQLESLSSLLDSDRRLFVSRVEQTTQMLGRQQITATTKREVQAYLAYDWSAHRGIHPNDVLQSVPDLVRQSLSISLALDTVSAVTLFAGAERDFIAAIVTLCEPTTWVAVPGQWIVREGDMGDCMYFVHSGKLEVLREKEDGSMLMVRELGAGDYFGEMALFIATARRSASVRSIAHTELFTLTKRAVDTAMRLFPDRAVLLRKAAQERYEQSVPVAPPIESRPLPKAETPSQIEHQVTPATKPESEMASAAGQLVTAAEGNSIDKQATRPRRGRVPIVRELTTMSTMIDVPGALKAEVQVTWLDRVASTVISFDSTTYKAWRWFVAVIICYNIFIVPYRCAFYPDLASPLILALDYVGDLCLLLDVLILSHTSFLDRGIIVRDLSLIRQQYSWFWFDFATSLPLLDLLMLYLGMQPALRIPRLLKIPQLLGRFEQRISSAAHSNNIMIMLFVVFVVSHWTACAYFAFTLYPPYSAAQDGTDWLPGSTFTSAPLSFLAYQRAFHFAVSFLTANGPILSPQTSGQYLFTDAITIFGKFCIAYLVCTISTALTDLTASQTQFGALMFRMNAFLRQHVAPAELCQRINKHFQHRFSLGLDVQTTLNMLPIHLHASITLELAGDLLSSMRLFAPGDSLSESRSESLIRALASELQFEAFPDGAFVYRSGEVGCKMYIVCGGRVELFADTVEELTTIEEVQSDSDAERIDDNNDEPPAVVPMPAYRRSMSIDAFAHLDETIVEEDDSNDDSSRCSSAPASSRDEQWKHTVSRGGVFGERGLTLTSRLVNARAIGALSVLSLSAESCTKLGRAGFHELEQRIAVIARSTIDSDVAGK